MGKGFEIFFGCNVENFYRFIVLNQGLFWDIGKLSLKNWSL